MKKHSVKILSVLMLVTLLAALFAPAVSATESSSSTSTTTTTTGTGSTNSSSAKDITFEIEADSSSVRAKELVNVTVTMKNNSSKDVNELEFCLDFDTSRVLGFTTEFSATLNGVTSPNDNSPVVLRQSGSTVKIYNYDPSTSGSKRAPLKAGSTLMIKFPMVISENAPTGAASFTLSGCKATDANGSAFAVGSYPTAKVNIASVSSNANLSELVVSVNDAPVTLTPAFSPDVVQYTVTVGNTIPSIKFNVQCADDRATFAAEKPSQLAVGSNNFKFTVTAEDKISTKVYTVTVRRLAPGETTISTTTTTTATTTTESTTTTTEFIPDINDITEDPNAFISTTAPTSPTKPGPVSPSDAKSGSTITLNLASLLGIVAAEIALFLLAFSAGYVTHKNAAQPQKYSVDELMEAQEKLDMQNRLLNGGTAAPQQPQPIYQPPVFAPQSAGYQAGYSAAPTYPEYSAGYNPAAGASEFVPQTNDFMPQTSDFVPQTADYGMPTAAPESPADTNLYGTNDVYYQ